MVYIMSTSRIPAGDSPARTVGRPRVPPRPRSTEIPLWRPVSASGILEIRPSARRGVFEHGRRNGGHPENAEQILRHAVGEGLPLLTSDKVMNPREGVSREERHDAAPLRLRPESRGTVGAGPSCEEDVQVDVEIDPGVLRPRKVRGWTVARA